MKLKDTLNMYLGFRFVIIMHTSSFKIFKPLVKLRESDLKMNKKYDHRFLKKLKFPLLRF